MYQRGTFYHELSHALLQGALGCHMWWGLNEGRSQYFEIHLQPELDPKSAEPANKLFSKEVEIGEVVTLPLATDQDGKVVGRSFLISEIKDFSMLFEWSIYTYDPTTGETNTVLLKRSAGNRKWFYRDDDLYGRGDIIDTQRA
jgi:hypothetical protein